MSKTVLIADDDEMSNLLIKILIKTSGISSDPVSFRNGKELLDYLSSQNGNQKEYLILLDINMPVMNGWEFLNAVENNDSFNNIAVVFVTSSTNQTDKVKASAYKKVKAFLEKPLQLEDMKKIKIL